MLSVFTLTHETVDGKNSKASSAIQLRSVYFLDALNVDVMMITHNRLKQYELLLNILNNLCSSHGFVIYILGLYNCF